METLPIDFDLTLAQLSEWHDKWRLERFGSNDNTRYYQYRWALFIRYFA